MNLIMPKVLWELDLDEFVTIQTSLYFLAEEFSEKLTQTVNPDMKSFYGKKLNVISNLIQKKFVTSMEGDIY